MPWSSSAALALVASSLSFSAVALWVAWRELRRLLRPAPTPLSTPLWVVMPARNEPDVQVAMDAVLADPSPQLHLLVVDDRSTDDTAERVGAVCARDPRARLLSLAEEPPPGVFGKPRALAAGERQVPEDVGEILFLDADVLVAPGALGALVASCRACGAHALSGVPRLQVHGLMEQLWVPTLASFVTSRFLPSRVHNARDSTAFLNGQVILVDRARLRAVGGWDAVAHTVLEDVALAKRLKEHGGVLRLVDLRALLSTRMARDVGEVMESFGKNATALLAPRAGGLALAALLTALLPWLAVALAWGDADVLPLVVGAAASSLACAAMARRLAGAPVWPVLLLPVSYLGAAVVLVGASLRELRRRPITWKGRSYPAR